MTQWHFFDYIQVLVCLWFAFAWIRLGQLCISIYKRTAPYSRCLETFLRVVLNNLMATSRVSGIGYWTVIIRGVSSHESIHPETCSTINSWTWGKRPWNSLTKSKAHDRNQYLAEDHSHCKISWEMWQTTKFLPCCLLPVPQVVVPALHHTLSTVKGIGMLCKDSLR